MNDLATLRDGDRVGADEATALAAVMAHYADMVYGTCRRVLGDPHEAADVTQETFFQFLGHADQITGSVGAWLHQVATHRAIDLVRQNSARRRREAAYAAEAPHLPDTWAEVEPLVDEALAALPDDERELLVLHFLQRQTMTQLAQAYGVSQPTVSRRVALALDCLRAQLRARGLVVGVVALGTMLPGSVHAAPPIVLQALGKMSLAHAASISSAASAGTGAFWAVGLTKQAIWAGAGMAVVLVTWLAWRPPGANPADRDSSPASAPRILAAVSDEPSGGAQPPVEGPPEVAASGLSSTPAIPVDPGPSSDPRPGPTTSATAAGAGDATAGGGTWWAASAVSRFGGRRPGAGGGGSFSGVAGAYAMMGGASPGSASAVEGLVTASSFAGPGGFLTNGFLWRPALAAETRRAHFP